MKSLHKTGVAYWKLAVGAAALAAGSLIGAHASGDLPKMRSWIESHYKDSFSSSAPSVPAQVLTKLEVGSMDAGCSK